MRNQDLDQLVEYLVCPRCRYQKLSRTKNYLHCPDCEARYPIIKKIPVVVSPEKQKRVLKDWQEEKGKGNHSSLIKTLRIEKMLKDFSQRRFALDACCGAGTYTDCFYSGSLGFDIVAYFVEMALKRNKSAKNLFCVADANEFPFKERAFGLVYCGQSLEHFSRNQSEALVEKLSKASTDLLLVDVPNDKAIFNEILSSLVRRFYRSKSKRKPARSGCPEQKHRQAFSPKDFRKLGFRCHGCVGSNTRSQIHLPLFQDFKEATVFGSTDEASRVSPSANRQRRKWNRRPQVPAYGNLFWDLWDRILFEWPLFGTLIGIKEVNHQG
jgi:uncharacterized protein YbaR (Trm112 family)